MYQVIFTLLGFVAWFAALGLINTRITHRATARGLCPMCTGAGREFVQMNGLEGCLECTDGTLASYRATMQAQSRKARA